MPRRKASIYNIASNHSRAIESQLLLLAEQAVSGDINGLTYALSDKNKSLRVGRMGGHSGDPDKAIASLVRCTVALVMSG